MEDTRERADAELRGHLEPALGATGATLLLDRLPLPGGDMVTAAQLEDMDERLEVRFDQIDRRFDQIDQRFEQIDVRFEQIDQRFDQIDQRFEQIDRRFIDVDTSIKVQSAELRQAMHEIVGAAFRSQLLFVLFGTAGLVLTLVAAATGLAYLL